MLRYAVGAGEHSVAAATTVLDLSRACSVVMLLAYVAYLFFQLKTHAQLFEPQEVDDGCEAEEDEQAVIGFASGLFWLAFNTVLIAILSEYVVGTIEPTSKSWGLSVSFISIILLPIVGNAAEHAGAIIFALKNKLDITLGVALGSATQISMFVVPLSVIVAWIAGIQMDLDFKLIETGSLFVSVIVTAFTLQDGSSHYLKGILLLLCYIVIGACFFVTRQPASNNNGAGLSLPTGTLSAQAA
ncbi:Vacuolar cation/proton exchanger 3 [Zea mays]|nr:Vacuolar cation/proton exchanger 3 [Zea mays]